MNKYYVYAYIRDKDSEHGKTGTPYYIGKGSGKRAHGHKKTERVPTPNDKSRILILENNLTEIGAFAIERRLIRWYGRIDLGSGILRNTSDGGSQPPSRLGSKDSEQTRIKKSLSNTGIKRSEEQKKAISARTKGNKGRTGLNNSDIHRKKQSNAIKLWWEKRKNEKSC